MLKSFVVAAALTSVALAQSNSSSLIPTGISQGCSDFLTKLNEDAQLATCAKGLTDALSAFAPGSTSTPSAAAVNSALSTICSDSIKTSCPANTIEAKLTEFYKACPAELSTSPNAGVVAIYDNLYTIAPLQAAVCSKDDSGSYCALSATLADGASADSLQKSLYTESNQVIVPNADTFSKNNVPFLFISPELPADKLCQACTRNVLMAYITHEGNVPSATALSNSPMLHTQEALYNAVSTKCGATFMDSQVKAAGGIKSGAFGSSSGAAPVAEFKGLMAAVAGLMTLAVTVL